MEKIKEKSDSDPYWTELKGIAEERLQSAEKAVELKETQQRAAKEIAEREPTKEDKYLLEIRKKLAAKYEREDKEREERRRRREAAK